MTQKFPAARSSSWMLPLALLASFCLNVDALAQSCCSANPDGAHANGHSQSDHGSACSAHGALGLPDSPTGRMVHAFIDLTYTSGDDALAAFLEENLAPASRERNGDESLLDALRTLRGDLPKGQVKSARKTGANSAEFVVASSETGAVATLSFELETDPPHRIDRLSAELGQDAGGQGGPSCGTGQATVEDSGDPNVVLPSLADSLDPLIERFNEDKDKLRFVALLSPTCGGCLRGARAIEQSILEAFPDTDVSVHVVWLPMLGSDNEAAAKRSSRMYQDSRVHQYYDPDRSAGWAYTNDVFPDMSEKMQAALPADHVLRTEGGPPGKGAAWDIYMLYEPGIEWTDAVPEPTSWVMQTIPGYTLIWKNDFGKPPFRSELVDEIRVLMQEALSGEPSLRAANRLLDVD